VDNVRHHLRQFEAVVEGPTEIGWAVSYRVVEAVTFHEAYAKAKAGLASGEILRGVNEVGKVEG